MEEMFQSFPLLTVLTGAVADVSFDQIGVHPSAVSICGSVSKCQCLPCVFVDHVVGSHVVAWLVMDASSLRHGRCNGCFSL